MELRCRVEGSDALVIELNVEALDAGNVRAFKEAIAPLLLRQPLIVLSLRDVAFIDSSGVGVLLSCLRAVTANRGELRLCHLSPNVQVLFELMRMQRVFHLHNTVEDALNAEHV